MNNDMTCEQAGLLIDELVQDTLSSPDRAALDAHLATCEGCRKLVSDVEHIVAQARTLPVLHPSRDLWSGIASQLAEQDAPLVLANAEAATSLSDYRNNTSARRVLSVRQLAAAAVLLIAGTAGITWNLAQSAALGRAALPALASNAIPAGDADSGAFGAGDPEVDSRYIANSEEDVNAIYEGEISALRDIVEQRFSELDPATVSALRKNLHIIDKAIEESKAALERDPRSSKYSRELNHAIEQKFELMRKVALL